jgi:hypothetical protein
MVENMIELYGTKMIINNKLVINWFIIFLWINLNKKV